MAASPRRRSWTAISAATVVMMFSYFTYAAAFVDQTGDTDRIEVPLAAIGLGIAPFVFVIVAFVSSHPRAPSRVVQAMLVLLGVGLSVGLIDPLLGAATGFALGGALALRRPPVRRVLAWRLAAAGLTAIYVLVLLVVASPAGVFSGGVLPLIMIGFADEYAIWSHDGTEV